jgi:alpha-galactosidase
MEEKIVLIGAGSAVFTRGLIADLLEMGWDAELRLVDIDPDALAVAEGLSRKMIEARKAEVTLKASVDRREMLPGATVVITTIGVGGRRAWEQDVFVPRKFGIHYPVGDSVGPGGTSRALRMINAMADIARDIAELAPDALFFNYGNPMTAVCRGIRKATAVPVTGLCHGVPWVGRYLADALKVPHKEFSYNAVGVNHLTWFVEAWHKGEDVMPRLREIAAARVKDGATKENGPMDHDSGHAAGGEPFSWSLTHAFGAFPACMDRHVVEFFPQMFPGGRYYGKTLGVDAIGFEPVIEHGDKGYEEMRRDATSKEPLPADYFKRGEGEHEQVLAIIEIIRTNDGRVYSANLPNQGQVPDLPAEAVLESPARAYASGLRPITMKPLGPGLAGTLATRLQWVETTVDAALSGSRELFVQALLIDGAVQSVDMAAKLADALLEAQRDYLPQFRK